MAKHYYAKCCFCSVLLMLSVTCKPFMLSVVMLTVIMLSVATPKAQLKYRQKILWACTV